MHSRNGQSRIRVIQTEAHLCTSIDNSYQVKPRFNGLCGSDLHAYFDDNFAHVGFVHPLTGQQPPIGFGHEFSGEVMEVGEGVTSLRPGDKVAVNPVLSDSACDSCIQGAPNCCRMLGFLGIHGGGGGLSDAVVVQENMAYKLPTGMDLELGALVEPLAVGWHGVGLVKHIQAETIALVLGGGPVGCAVVLALKAKGVKHILVSEPSEARAQVIREIGVTEIYNPLTDSVVEKVMQYTDGRGPDSVFDCAGIPITFETACKVVRTRGQVVILSLWPSTIPFNPSGPLMFKEASLHATVAYTPEDFRAVINALDSGDMNASVMVTKRIPIGKLIEEGLKPLHDPKIGHCKILVDLAL